MTMSHKPGPADMSGAREGESVRLEYLAQSARLNSNTLQKESGRRLEKRTQGLCCDKFE